MPSKNPLPRRLKSKTIILLHNYDLFLERQARLFDAMNSSDEFASDDLEERRKLLLLDDLTIFAVAARRLMDITGTRSSCEKVKTPRLAVVEDENRITISELADNKLGFYTLCNRLVHMSNFELARDYRDLYRFVPRSRTNDELYKIVTRRDERLPDFICMIEEGNASSEVRLRDIVLASIKAAEKITDVCSDSGVYLELSIRMA